MTPLEHVEALLEGATHSVECRTVISRAYYAAFRKVMTVSEPRGFARTKHAPGKPSGIHYQLFEFLRASPDPVLRKVATHCMDDLYSLRIVADYRYAQPVTKRQAEESVRLTQDVHDWLSNAA